MTEVNCKYCGYNHGIIKDVVCPISSNKMGLPISEEKESFFAMEIDILQHKYEKQNKPNLEFVEYLKKVPLGTRTGEFNVPRKKRVMENKNV